MMSNEELMEGDAAKVNQPGLVGNRPHRPNFYYILQVYLMKVGRLWQNTGQNLLIKKGK